MQADTHEAAFDAERKAAELEPGNLAYAINFAYVLLNAGKTEEAKTLIMKIRESAETPQDRASAEELAIAVENREGYEQQRQKSAARAGEPPQQTPTEPVSEEKTTAAQTDQSMHAHETEYAVEGIITLADCCADGRGKVTLTVAHTALKFTYANLAELQVISSIKAETDSPPTCAVWKGWRARRYFYKTEEKPYIGEIETVQFF